MSIVNYQSLLGKLRYIVLVTVMVLGVGVIQAKPKAKQQPLTAEEQMRLDYYLYAALDASERQSHAQAYFLLEYCYQIDSLNPTVCSMLGAYKQSLYGMKYTPQRVISGDPAYHAYTLIRRAYEGSPHDYWYRYAIASYDEGQHRITMDVLKAMEKREPKNTDVLELHERILRIKHQYKQALAIRDKIDKLTGEPTAYSVVTRYEILNEWGREDQAVQVLDDYLKRNPNDGRMRAMRADIELTRAYKRDDKQAGKRLLDEQIDNPEVPLQAKMKKINQYTEWLGYDMQAQRSILDRLLKQYPKDSDLRERISDFMRDDTTTTDEQFRQFIEESYALLPDNPKWGYMKALLCYRDNDLDSMLIVLENAVAHATEPTTRLPLLILYGDMLGQKGDYPRAFAAYDEVLQLQPEHLGTLNNYAWSLAISGGDLKKAEKMSQRTIQKEGNNPTFLDTYAWILHLQGQDTLALFYIRKALEYAGEEKDSTLYEHYREIKMKAEGL